MRTSQASTAARARRARAGVAGAGDHGPGLGDRVDPALVVPGRAERRAVVEVGPAIPVAVPGVRSRRWRRGSPRMARSREARGASPRESARGANSPRMASWNQATQTLSPRPSGADPVHPVVPVAGPHQRESVRPEPHPVPDRADAVLVKRAGLVGDRRQAVIVLLAGTQERAFQVALRVRRRWRRRRSPGRSAGRRTGARGSRPRTGCGPLGRRAGATSAARPPRRTGGTPRAGSEHGPTQGRRGPGPSRPEAGRGTRTRRPTGRRPNAPRPGSSGPDRPASG